MYILLVLCSLAIGASAETKDERMQLKHELRIGWGDQLFERLVWQNKPYIISIMPETFQETNPENYKYYEHVWIEYQQRHNTWFSYGGMIDFSGVGWTEVTRNGKGQIISQDPNHNFFNVVFMPTIQFTYLHHEYVNMYFGMGIGMGINTGTETNGNGKKNDVGMAVNLSVIGISANYKRWFAAFDVGGLYSIKNTNTIFLASSRILNVSLGVRF